MAWKKHKTKNIYTPMEICKEYKYLELNKLKLTDLNNRYRELAEVTNTNNNYIIEYFEEPLAILPSGIYKTVDVSFNLHLMPLSLSHDKKLFQLDITEDIIKDFEFFIEKKELYTEFGLIYKRGILLYGPPGTGKTTVINSIVEKISPPDSIIIFSDQLLSHEMLDALKDDPRLKIIVLEEITTIAKLKVESLLTFLDGNSTLKNCYILATTNYPEELPGNLVERPGRFDRLFKVDYLSYEDRIKYLTYFLKRPPTEEELELTKEQSIAFLKEWLLITKKENVSLKEAHTIIKKHKETVKNNFKKYTPKVGFINDDDDDD